MNIIIVYALVILVIFLFFKLIQIVSEAEAFIVEQFGKYNRTLGAGLHLVVPIIQKVAYKIELREQVIDVEPQFCITSDNVQVSVDGILYLRVIDPMKASYGIDNYRFATVQLAKTTMRSEIGKLELDTSFSERDAINEAIVKAIDEASDPWGIKVTRYEIKDITPTEGVEKAMEQQMRAEREKRAEILSSEGQKESRINVSKGERQYAINLSEGERERRINESEGRANAIEITSQATAEGLGLIAEVLKLPKGKNAMTLRLAEQYVSRFGEILDRVDTSILPLDVAQVKSLIDAVRPEVKNNLARTGGSGSFERARDHNNKAGGPDAESEGGTQ